MEERQEIVWASALSCLFYFVCDGGKIIRSRLGGLDIRVCLKFCFAALLSADFHTHLYYVKGKNVGDCFI